MKKLVCFIFILGLAVSFVFAGGSKEKQAAGKIVIYTSMYPDVIEAVQKDLSRQFPKCNIEFFYGGTGILQARIDAEKASGRLGCDILLVAEPAYSMELKENGMLHAYTSKEASNLAFTYDPDGYWYPVRISNMVLAYNPERHAKNTLPPSFHDLGIDTSVRGAISMRNPLVSGTTMATITALKDKYGYEYFDALGRQRVQIDYGADETLRKLENGECKVVMILEESILRKRQMENAKLEIMYPADGAIVIPSTIMIINDRWNANKNTRAAEAISEWFLGPEGQNAIVNGWMHSVRTDFPQIPHGSIPITAIQSNSMPVHWENVFRQRQEIRRNFEERVSSRR